MEYILSADRADQDRNGKIRTFSGLYVNPLQMQLDDICIEDIAHHLSNECRYSGAVPEFYSVAEHSVYVARRIYNETHDPVFALAGLLHDAAEAYLGDMSSPVKHAPEMLFYREADERLTRLVFTKFGLDTMLIAKVKPYDDAVFQDEVTDFWGQDDLGFVSWDTYLPRAAKQAFLIAFRKYQAVIAADRMAGVA